ncbi:MAG: hypothetical protein ABH811_02215 [archaeon]
MRNPKEERKKFWEEIIGVETYNEKTKKIEIIEEIISKSPLNLRTNKGNIINLVEKSDRYLSGIDKEIPYKYK